MARVLPVEATEARDMAPFLPSSVPAPARLAPRTLSVCRGLALGLASLALLGAGLFGWGLLASISGAVVAAGRVATEGGEQVVEHVDGGAVAAIRVRDGDRVAAGNVLVRIDGAALESAAAALAAELNELVARRNRLEAEALEADRIDWDAELVEAAGANPAARAAMDGHRRLFEARRATRAGLTMQLRERIGQTRRQIAGLDAQARALAEQKALVAEELEAKQRLLDRGFAQRPEVLALKRRAAGLEGEAGDVAAQIAAARGRMAEIGVRILQIGAERLEGAEAEARNVQARETSLRERLGGLRERLGRLEVRAPAAGIVHDLAVSAAGEVLQPGEPVAKVVPEGAAFTVRARVAPTDVDQVSPGQPAVLRFSAFPARTTPEYEGEVVRVSADALADARSGLAWYEVEIAIGAPVGDRGARPLALAPGMPVEAYLQTGARSPLGWLVKPLTDYFARSLREE